jgi:hypothetical protein
MNSRRHEKRACGVEQPGAPKLVRSARCHSDHPEKRRDEAATEQAVVRGRLVEVISACKRHDCFQVRRAFDRGLHLRAGKVADANHTDIAIGPWLHAGSFDQIVHVAALLVIIETKCSPRPAGSTDASNDVNISAWDKIVGSSGFDEPEGCS